MSGIVNPNAQRQCSFCWQSYTDGTGHNYADCAIRIQWQIGSLEKQLGELPQRIRHTNQNLLEARHCATMQTAGKWLDPFPPPELVSEVGT